MIFRNLLLQAISLNGLGTLQSELVEVPVSRNQVLVDEGIAPDHLYFPGTAVTSLVMVMRDRRAVETSTIGSESAPAILAALTGGASAARVFIQVAGSVIRLPVTGLRQAAFARPEVMLTLLQFAQRDAYVSDLSVACNALHNVPARLARWLLLTQDRVGGAVIPLTQDHLSIMLGVQRTTVTGAAQSLKRDGLIRYSRGQITIVDRLRLIEASCECYGEQTRRYAS